MTDESNSVQRLTPTSPDGLPGEMPQPSPGVPVFPQEAPGEKIEKTPASRVPSWRFLAAMLLQSALIVGVPLQSALTYMQGETVTLKTLPVDPYDPLRGYSQTLRFDISNVSTLKSLPGGESVFTWQNKGELIYVTLASPSVANAEPEDIGAPEAWPPVAVSLARPESLVSGQVALQGRYRSRRVDYGLETYYMPEAQRNDINDQIRQVQREDADAFVVDVKVDAKGNSVPQSLWISDQEYQF